DEEKALAQANESLQRYGEQFGTAYLAGLRRKFGLFTEHNDDSDLIKDFLKQLMDNGLDYTLSFRALSNGVMPVDDADWIARYRARRARDPQSAAERHAAMRSVNPLYTPRNPRVEAALAAAMGDDDYGPFEELLAVLPRPFEERSQYAAYTQPP